MKTKEEILNKCHWDFVNEKGISSIHTKEFPSAYSEQTQRAMGEYAKEQAIAFAFHMLKDYTGKLFDPTENNLLSEHYDKLEKP